MAACSGSVLLPHVASDCSAAPDGGTGERQATCHTAPPSLEEEGKAKERELSWPHARTDRQIVRPLRRRNKRPVGRSRSVRWKIIRSSSFLFFALSRENGRAGARRRTRAADETSRGSCELQAAAAVIRVLGIAAHFVRCAHAWHVLPDLLETFHSLAMMMKWLSDSRYMSHSLLYA